jgi:chromate transporter
VIRDRLLAHEDGMKDRNGSDAPTPAELLLPDPGACEGELAATAGPRRVSTLVLCSIFLEIGATAFGGMGPTLAIIERELVKKRQALTADDVAEAWAATRLLPGSSLIQVVSFIGYRLGGWSGSVLATVACVLPPVTAMLLLAVFYPRVAALPAFGPATQGLGAAVVGLLLATTYRFGRATLGNRVALGIALCAFGSTVVLGIPSAAIIVAAGLIGVPLLSAPGTGEGSRIGKRS